MSSINWRRVILGGLLAGMRINVIEFILNGIVLAKDWEAAIVALGRPPISGSQIAVFFVWSFILWVYSVNPGRQCTYAVLIAVCRPSINHHVVAFT